MFYFKKKNAGNEKENFTNFAYLKQNENTLVK